MKKRIITIALTAAMAAGLAACGSSGTGSSSTGGSAGAEGSAKAETTGKHYTIGIDQSLEHQSLDKATKGFEAAVNKKFGKDNVTIDLQNAQNEAANNATICNGFVSSKVNLILANATPALQAASQATADIPVLGTSVTDYGEALGIDDFSGKTGTNVSGTSDLAPIDQQEHIFKELLPDAKNIAILYCSAEPNSIVQAKSFEKYAKKDGFQVKVYTAADSNEIQSVTTKACQECDALYIPTDNTFAAAIETVKNVVQPAKKPLVTGWGDVDAGIAAVSIDYYELGYQTGEMAYEILANGKKPGDMEVQTAKSTQKTYNKELCKELGIKVPDGYTAA
ncbi:MAG: ABC transporter substrate-binding protein [Eubacterium sp.]|jgi:putative ABC transport system substrate-binding protein